MYPERASSNVGRTRGKLLSLQTESLNVNNANDAIWVGEWNANDNGNLRWRQTMGAMMSLFTTTRLAEYMQAGVRYATWYAQGLSNVCMIPEPSTGFVFPWLLHISRHLCHGKRSLPYSSGQGLPLIAQAF
jgi:hypothetical protein